MSNPATDPLRPLVDGEHLSSGEFDLRYEVSPHIRRAELIRGVVRVASPSSMEHEDLILLLHGWLFTYALLRPEVHASASPTLHLPNGGRAEPDAVLCRVGEQAKSRRVGQGESARLHGAPELLVEVSLSTLAHDVDDVEGKRADYRESGVDEYLVVAPLLGRVFWWRLVDDAYQLIPEVQGAIESHAFQGLRLNVAALLALDGKAVVDALG